MMALEAQARPFLKWAGGKGRLLKQMSRFLPQALHEGRIRRYVEPFVGGGAFFFYLQARFALEEFHLFDRSPELVLVYQVVKRDVEALIASLKQIEADYLTLDHEQRKATYYEVRTSFNDQRTAIDFGRYDARWIERAAQLIFLNRTCYNGLFRVNSRGEFNVPAGRYERPRICHEANLRAASWALQGAVIKQGDFAESESLIDERTLVYFDPPYRPLSRTAAFNAYARSSFGDAEQLRLADYYRDLDARGGWLMLSNSDPKNVDPKDDFFDEAYDGFRIERIKAARAINSKGSRRGMVSELLVLNY